MKQQNIKIIKEGKRIVEQIRNQNFFKQDNIVILITDNILV